MALVQLGQDVGDNPFTAYFFGDLSLTRHQRRSDAAICAHSLLPFLNFTRAGRLGKQTVGLPFPFLTLCFVVKRHGVGTDPQAVFKDPRQIAAKSITRDKPDEGREDRGIRPVRFFELIHPCFHQRLHDGRACGHVGTSISVLQNGCEVRHMDRAPSQRQESL
ncbi:MAG: hypothetical protein CL814_18800 [Confluentimicrobium sp.]|uniref:Uncharacterized protein n=1 Tax=Maritimibacter alkaliphilus HTCC2654 TaxID=314271 RepID=A3VIZ0_9RHOB|nr:hypothetical protein RB2654_00570 [Rhodobacterales bacterium HTCC2654] [Maritimibacter alkaliphilus HTCC2654]MBC58961.1 hypothetical protein [Actibacterium sp.]